MVKETFSVLTAKIVGQTQEGVWAQVATLGHLQAVMVLSHGGDGQLGRKLLGFLAEENQQLVKKNLAELSALVEKLQEQIPATIQPSLVVAMPVGKVLYLAAQNGTAFLKRGEKLEKIIAGSERASGFLQDGDLLILGSKQFFQVITPEILVENLNHFSPQEIAEALAPKILATEESAYCAALILSFQKGEKEWVEEEVGEEKREEEEVKPSRNFWGVFGQKLRFLKIKWPKFPRTLYLPTEGTSGREKRTLLTVALLLVALLVTSIFFGILKTRESEKTKKFEGAYRSVNFKYEEGKGLVGLNDILARNRLAEAKGELEEIKKISSLKREQAEKISALSEKIKESLVVLSRIYKLGSLPLFWEINLVKAGSEGESLAIFEDQLAILDRKNHLIYQLLVKTKAFKTLGGEELKEEPKLLGFHGENLYLLTREGIIRLETRSKKTEMVVERDEGWEEIVSLAAYAGNLYLLDRKKSSIWKYLVTETGFSSPRSYFPSDIKPDFSQAKDMAIDGSIWVLLPGQVAKFTQGRPDNFKILGLESSFGEPQAIFTDEKSKNLYLLDPTQKKVLVLGKDGAYQAQYEAPEIGQAKDLVVSEEEKKIFLLAGSKVYYIEIKP